MEYNVTEWMDGEEGGTPIDAASLNNIEHGISQVTNYINNLDIDNEVTWNDVQDKPETFPTNWEEIKDKPETFPVDWEEVKNKPESFPTNWEEIEDKPETFPISWSDVLSKPFKRLDPVGGLETDGDGLLKISDSFRPKNISWSDIQNKPNLEVATVEEVKEYFSIGD